MKQNGRKRNNRIWILFGAVVAVVLSLYGIRNGFASVLALEQQARCGAQEHTHTAQCYDQGALTCRLTEHTHSDNCYLVLLEDNDINHVLSQVDQDPENNLENVIHSVVGTALTYNSDFTPVKGQNGAYTQNLSSPGSGNNVSTVDIAALNNTITENDIQPSLVLNEDLYTNGSQTQAGLLGATTAGNTGNTGASTLALGDPAQTGTYNGNFYVYLDGGWQRVGGLNFSITSSSPYSARLSTASVISLYNNVLGSSYTSSNIHLIYAASATANAQNWYDVSVSSQYTVLGDDYLTRSTARAAKYVRLVDEDGDPEAYYTVKLVDQNGNTTTKYIRSGDSITLPAETAWSDGTNLYRGGDAVVISGKTTFTASNETPTPSTQKVIQYNLNYSTSSASQVGVSVTAPTVMGGNNYTQTVEQGSVATICAVSETLLTNSMPVATNSNARPGVVRFLGWKVGNTNTILAPGRSLSWTELNELTLGNTLTLTGQWEYTRTSSVNFFVRYDSSNVSGGGSNLYTKVIYVTYYGGETKAISDDSIAAAVKDQQIRALVGEKDQGGWLATFPTDDYVFNVLKDYSSTLRVDGQAVSASDLNENGYAIRWYNLAYVPDDSNWHVDGLLVRKQGYLDVTKTFAGNKRAIEQAKDGGFAIRATSEKGTTHELTLDEAQYNAATDTYSWRIENVTYGEKWTLKEINAGEAYTEYIVVDALGDQSGYGVYDPNNGVTVTGQTYATDVGLDEVMSVDFTNIYRSNDSIVLKKEDATTKAALPGAQFQLLQNGQLLKFLYDADTKIYTCDANGTITTLAGDSAGFLEITVTGLDFDSGDITVHESKVPDGYVSSGDVVLAKPGEEIQIKSGSGQITSGVLIIGNASTETSVTAEKHWTNTADAKPVTVQLLANDRLVSALFPQISSTVVLNQANSYTYTWDDMPLYANGVKIQWSLREIQIGDERCKDDYTFSNWTVTYSPVQEITDDDGEIINSLLTVTNTKKDGTTLIVVKSDTAGARLSGAVFELQLLKSDGTADPDFVPIVKTSDANGMMTFTDLPYGNYVLTETAEPGGYDGLTRPVRLTLHDNRTVSITENAEGMASVLSATDLAVGIQNRALTPLPSTGGSGPGIFATVGAALMLFAVCGYILPRYRKKGGYGAET